MRELGYLEGKNLAIEWRSPEGKFERLPDIIRELVALNVDVIVSPIDVVIKAAKTVTSTIPIVMAGVTSPVELGFVQSLSRPGGNITGLSTQVLDLLGKRVELIKELVPNMRRLAFLNSEENAPEVARTLEETSSRMGFSFLLAVQSVRDFANAFTLVRRERFDAMYVSLSPGSFQNRHSIVEFAAESHLPTIYPMRSFTEAGGLISLGANFEDLSRRAAGYVVRILEGANPADLPVEQPNKFDLIVNLRTAQALGLTVPASVLVQATEVID
jgi:putative ABC transport system substrate-binding protein